MKTTFCFQMVGLIYAIRSVDILVWLRELHRVNQDIIIFAYHLTLTVFDHPPQQKVQQHFFPLSQ